MDVVDRPADGLRVNLMAIISTAALPETMGYSSVRLGVAHSSKKGRSILPYVRERVPCHRPLDCKKNVRNRVGFIAWVD